MTSPSTPLWPAGHLPRKGEIGNLAFGAFPATFEISESRRDI